MAFVDASRCRTKKKTEDKEEDCGQRVPRRKTAWKADGYGRRKPLAQVAVDGNDVYDLIAANHAATRI